MSVQVEQANTDGLWEIQRSRVRTTRGRARLRALLPDAPGSIAVVFHALYERPGFENDGSTWDSSTVAHADPDPALEAILAASTHTYSSPGSDDAIGPRVRWKDLVGSLGLPWNLEVDVDTISAACGGSWPAHIWGPEEGNLDEEQLGALIAVMIQAGVAQSSFAAHPIFRCEPMEHWRWTFELREFLAVRHHPINKYGEGPSEVMAADGSWALLQDIDLPYTLLLADEEVIRQILEHPTLEAIAIPSSSPAEADSDCGA